MFFGNLKPTLISVFLALVATAGISPSASAHDYGAGIGISGKYGQVYIGDVHHRHYRNHRRYYHDPYAGQRYYKKRRHHRQYGHCGPRRALDKAWRMGVNRPHVARIGDRRIVVKGRKRGRMAKVVFARLSSNCHVIGTHGLWRRAY